MASILCATQTEDGYLWIGSDGGELIRFDGEEFKEIRFEHNDNYHHYRSLFSVSDGILFASEYKGFHKYDYKRKKFLRLDS